jgi:hypothetical protein
VHEKPKSAKAGGSDADASAEGREIIQHAEQEITRIFSLRKFKVVQKHNMLGSSRKVCGSKCGS